MKPVSLFVSLAVTALLWGGLTSARPPELQSQPAPPLVDPFKTLADDATQQMMATSVYQSKIAPGHRVRVVVGDIINNSDNESVRVEDIFDDIRNTLVSSGTVRLFEPGELNVDLIISPVLTSRYQVDRNNRRHACFKLELTLTTPAGENITAVSSTGCNF